MSFHGPQIAILSLMALNLVLTAALDGQPRKGTYKFSLTVISAAGWLWLLWLGGFFAPH